MARILTCIREGDVAPQVEVFTCGSNKDDVWTLWNRIAPLRQGEAFALF